MKWTRECNMQQQNHLLSKNWVVQEGMFCGHDLDYCLYKPPDENNSGNIIKIDGRGLTQLGLKEFNLP